MKSKHIEVMQVDATIELIVDDYELFDYVEDLVIEKGLEYEFISEEVRDGRQFYKMHFGEDVKKAHLTEVVEAIPEDEIHRIWKLNNPGSFA